METKYQEGDIVEFYDSRGDIDTMEILAVHDNGDYELQREWNVDWSIYVEKDRIIRLVGGPRFIPSWKATKCHRYKGTKEEYTRYIDSHLWKRKRAKIVAREYKRCRLCGEREWLHVHHITYDRFGHEEEGDLVALCPKCHDLVHYMVDSAEYLLTDKDMETDSPLITAMFRIDPKILNGHFYNKEQAKDFLRLSVLTMFGEPFNYNYKYSIRAFDDEVSKMLFGD